MRTQTTLDVSNKQRIVHLENWSASGGTMVVSNPTGCTILIRYGGSDVPQNTASAQRVISPQSDVQFPVEGADFAFAFDPNDVARLGTVSYPISTAQISILSPDEPTSAIGSIFQIRPQYYDRNLLIYDLHFLANQVVPLALNTYWNYTVPAKRAAYLEMSRVQRSQLTAIGTPGQVNLNVTHANNRTSVNAQVISLDFIDNTVGNQWSEAAANFGLIGAGDGLSGVAGDSSIAPGVCTYRVTAKASEFDA